MKQPEPAAADAGASVTHVIPTATAPQFVGDFAAVDALPRRVPAPAWA